MQHKHDNLAAALDFQSKTGAHLFPILRYGQDGPKFPFRWGEPENHSNDPEQIKVWAKLFPGCAFGVNLGASEMVVVDVDDKHGDERDGTKSVEKLRAEGFDLPVDTLTTKTPSGKGYHLYYWGQCKNNNRGAVGESIDIKGPGGYVPAPGQKVMGKGMYSLRGSQIGIRNLPAWVREKVGEYTKKKKRERKELEYAVEPDQAHNITAAIKYLTLRAEKAYEGCRDDVSYKVACGVRDYAISMEQCEQLMGDFWLTRCEMGDWDMDNVRAKIESAYERADGAFGNADLSRHFKDVTKLDGFQADTTNHESEKRIRLPYLEKLRNASKYSHTINEAGIPKRKWLVHGRFLEGFITVTISPGGIGKSTLSILEALAVCSDRGKEWLNRKTYGAKAVWIYNLEDPQDELDRRVAAVAKHYDIALDGLDHLITTSGLTLGLTICKEGRHGIEINERALNACKDFIKENGIKLWVIDPLVKAHLVNENDNGSMDRLMTELSKIASETGCSVHLVHHTRKKAADTGIGDADTARGASSVVNAARVAHTLNPMSSKDAASYGVGEEKNWYLRLDDAKSNLTPPMGKGCWFRRHSVELANGDYVGVLQYTDLSHLVEKQDFNVRLQDAVIDHVQEGQIPTLNIARTIAATGEFTNDEGKPMGELGIKKAIERVFAIVVQRKGRTVQVKKETRSHTGRYPKNTASWIDCEMSDDLLAAQAVAKAKLEEASDW